jgi:hypothetical protein
MKQIRFARKKRQLQFLSKKLQHLLTEKKESTLHQVEILVLKIRRLIHELRFTYSRTDLKKVLGAAAVVIGISFSGQLSAQSFAPPVVNPFKLDSTYYIANPAFADLDGDGDQDLLVGEYYGAMQYFENTGTATAPSFAPPQTNPFGLVSTYDNAFPAFADLDNDGDMDLLAGEYYGAMKYFENTGSATAPQFAAPLTNPFKLDSVNYLAFPAFADLDDDGDLDLLVGEMYGAMQYFENIGSDSVPSFAPAQTNPFGLISTGGWAATSFTDLDEDGDMDLLVGEYYGNMKYFENTGSASAPQFAAPQENPFGLTPVFYAAFPAFADLDNDGDADLLVGEVNGAMQYFENTTITDILTLAEDFDLLLFPNPVKDILHIRTSEQIEQIEIFNTEGKSFDVIKTRSKQLSLNHLAPGLYFVKLTNAGGNYTVKQVHKQ